MKQTTFTREEVIKLIDTILECGSEVMDAISNEATSHDGESLLELGEYWINKQQKSID